MSRFEWDFVGGHALSRQYIAVHLSKDIQDTVTLLQGTKGSECTSVKRTILGVLPHLQASCRKLLAQRFRTCWDIQVMHQVCTMTPGRASLHIMATSAASIFSIAKLVLVYIGEQQGQGMGTRCLHVALCS